MSPFLFAIYLDDIIDYRLNGQSCYVILYADDILIIAQSVTELQRYLLICERELLWLGMSINIKKSCCMRIGPRYDAICNNILTTSGLDLPWVDEVRYLGVHLISAKHFKCNFDSNKRAFFKSINPVFGRIGRIASEEVVIELVIKKCLPILLYSTEACPINTSVAKSFDFIINRFLMKLFQTNNIYIIEDCRFHFRITLPSKLIETRSQRFVNKYNSGFNSFCKLFVR